MFDNIFSWIIALFIHKKKKIMDITFTTMEVSM